ncbi:ferritin-like domain-containing protein [Psychromarinibacter sp. C21-152]|uniref:Bacterioferritin n=1 Tax=Psychromarinibacter sediminicola TaxID=3033385 RepID=A0AAE3NQY1_9RHOB|nr:ferritin-like domain-containing protein [Psychromarinibacter sediminicola]MDF0602613.1 ferritin-like domain-containing protein [Psychromarinibacter sediminicola]
MKGPEVSLKHLQRALTMELTTVNTYLYQERQLDDWGIDRLAARMTEEIGEEREHATAFLTRLLFLEGEADVQTLDKIEPPKSVRHIFETQQKMELEAREYYDKAARECQEAGDLGTFELFMRILKDEEEHIDFVEEQFDLMEMIGDQLYIARQVSSVDEGAESVP